MNVRNSVFSRISVSLNIFSTISRVAAHGNALEAVVEIIVVVSETHWQARDDRCGQVLAITTPLLFGIALHKLLEDIHGQRARALVLRGSADR